MARPPCSWTRATERLSDRQGRMRRRSQSAHEVAAAGADLLAHDDLEGQAASRRDGPGRQGRVDALVVGDGDGVEAACHGRSRIDSTSETPSEASVWMCRSMRRRRSSLTRPPRSSQMGNNSVVHCSGARAMMRSKARASCSRIERVASRRLEAGRRTQRHRVAEPLARDRCARWPRGRAARRSARRARPGRWAAGPGRRRAPPRGRCRRCCGRPRAPTASPRRSAAVSARGGLADGHEVTPSALRTCSK